MKNEKIMCVFFLLKYMKLWSFPSEIKIERKSLILELFTTSPLTAIVYYYILRTYPRLSCVKLLGWELT